jgi:hypothetical protein
MKYRNKKSSGRGQTPPLRVSDHRSSSVWPQVVNSVWVGSIAYLNPSLSRLILKASVDVASFADCGKLFHLSTNVYPTHPRPPFPY